MFNRNYIGQYISVLIVFLVLIKSVVAETNTLFTPERQALKELAIKRLKQEAIGEPRIIENAATGLITFVRVDPGGDLLPNNTQNSLSEKSIIFLNQFSDIFGVRNTYTELVQAKIKTDVNNNTTIIYRQIYQGLPVFAGEVRVHYDEKNRLTAVNGLFIPNITTGITPIFDIGQANNFAVDTVKNMIHQLSVPDILESSEGPEIINLLNNKPKYSQSDINAVDVSRSRLVIYSINKALDTIGESRLAYQVEISNQNNINESVFIDAYTGETLDQFTNVHNVLYREIYFQDIGPIIAWSEGDPFPTGDSDIDKLIEYTEDAYNFFSSLSGGTFLSWDGADGIMKAVAHATNIEGCFFTAATWDGTKVNFCTGEVFDDIVGHEWSHAYTESTSGLLYFGQSGALNESFSDIWGETIDLLNGSGVDSPNTLRTDGGCSWYGSGVVKTDLSYRWLLGEEHYYGASRDLWNPDCRAIPGKVSDDTYWCDPNVDNGGVHTNSGIPDHAFALIVDGGTYNGQTIRGIGLNKASHIYWLAQTDYITPFSDFTTYAAALETACSVLSVGGGFNQISTDSPIPTGPIESIQADDCVQVSNALAAVEMTGQIANQCPDFKPDVPPLCGAGNMIEILHTTDFESGLGAWISGRRNVADPIGNRHYDWGIEPRSVEPFLFLALPAGKVGHAAFADDFRFSFCDGTGGDQSGVRYLESPPIVIPTNTGSIDPHVAFNHWYVMSRNLSGGNIKISVNAGPWTLVPAEAFVHNPYTSEIGINPPSDANPMSGEPVFADFGTGKYVGRWMQSQINLSSLAVAGDSIRLRYEIGTSCNGRYGWYIDDVQFYTCEKQTLSCSVYDSTDVPKLIPDVGINTIDSIIDINIATDTLGDVNINNLVGLHAEFSDLDFTLTSPQGTSVEVMSTSCWGTPNFNINLDDEAAAGPWPCPPTDAGIYQPSNPLSAFIGEDPNGSWTLTINDSFDYYGGYLLGWSLDICRSTPVDDIDNDGIGDRFDNCTLVANPDQRDTNSDGYGNMCDPDLTNDLIVNILDKLLMRNLIGTSDPHADLNGDGSVNIIDKIMMRDMVGQPPGPSALAP